MLLTHRSSGVMLRAAGCKMGQAAAVEEALPCPMTVTPLLRLPVLRLMCMSASASALGHMLLGHGRGCRPRWQGRQA